MTLISQHYSPHFAETLFFVLSHQPRGVDLRMGGSVRKQLHSSRQCTAAQGGGVLRPKIEVAEMWQKLTINPLA